MQETLYQRVAELEAIRQAELGETTAALQAAYAYACMTQDEPRAASILRTLRNRLLEESDKHMMMDRVGVDTSSLGALIQSLSHLLDGSWVRYRQALRELPEQAGFPLSVTFPVPPKEE